MTTPAQADSLRHSRLRLAARWYVADGRWHAPCGMTERDWLTEGNPLPEDPDFAAWASAYYHYDAVDAGELPQLEADLERLSSLYPLHDHSIS